MERKTIKQNIGDAKTFNAYVYNNDGYTPIEEVIKFFVQSNSLGATHVDWSATKDWDGDVEEVLAHPIKIFTETEEQAKERIKKEYEQTNIRLEDERQRKMAEYKKLQKELGIKP